MRDCVIFDMDGTLADVSSIRHYLDRPKGKKDFESFHGASIFVPPHSDVVELARSVYDLGLAVIVVTARQEKWYGITVQWLEKHDIPWSGLHMRPNGDFRPDVEIKSEILDELINAGYNPTLAVDDNPNIIRLWSSRNIPTIVVPGWDKWLTESEITRREVLDSAALL